MSHSGPGEWKWVPLPWDADEKTRQRRQLSYPDGDVMSAFALG